jgi:hypothetical protein
MIKLAVHVGVCPENPAVRLDEYVVFGTTWANNAPTVLPEMYFPSFIEELELELIYSS